MPIKRKNKGSNEAEKTAKTFEDAVSAVINAPPTPEQQAKKEATKARREARKREQQEQQQEQADE